MNSLTSTANFLNTDISNTNISQANSIQDSTSAGESQHISGQLAGRTVELIPYNNILDLPHECMLDIFKKLSIEDRLQTRKVCKGFKFHSDGSLSITSGFLKSMKRYKSGADDIYIRLDLMEELGRHNLENMEFIIKTFKLSINTIISNQLYDSGILHFAARIGFLAGVERLIELGSDVNLKDEYGTTALMEASKAGHVNVVRMLIKYRAKVNLQNKEGITALHKACNYLCRKNLTQDEQRAVRKQAAEVAKVLIDSGADIHAQDAYGEEPCLRRVGLKDLSS